MNAALKHSLVPAMSAAGILPTMSVGEAIHTAISKSNKTYRDISSSTGISVTRLKEFIQNRSATPTPREMKILREKLPDLYHLYPETPTAQATKPTMSVPPVVVENPGTPTIDFEVVTPEAAKTYMSKMTKNRRLDGNRVSKYVRDIESSCWHVTHQGIAFNLSGELIDGQHRLAAILKTGKAQTMAVARNIANEAMPAIDRGKPRTLANIIEVARNIDKGGPTESILRVLAFAYDQTNGYEAGGGDDILRLFDVHEDGILWSLGAFKEREFQNAAIRAAFALAWPAAKDEVTSLSRSVGSLDSIEGAAILLMKMGLSLKSKGTAKDRHNVFLKVLGILKEWATGATTGPAPSVRADEEHLGWWLDLRRAKSVD